jgi:hypothetical protein
MCGAVPPLRYTLHVMYRDDSIFYQVKDMGWERHEASKWEIKGEGGGMVVKRPLGKLRYRWEDNIKMESRSIG